MSSWINIGLFLQLMNVCCSSNEVFKAALHACEFEQSCSNTNAFSNETFHEEISCCRPCSCDKYCHERNLCCPDFNESSEYVPMSNYTQMCLPASRYADSLRVYEQYYFVRATCPVDFEGDELKEACEGNHVSSVDDAIFVTSQDGQVTYKNKHCALCHGEENFQKWGVATVRPCIKRFLMDTAPSEEINVSILSNCELLFIPPTMLNKISNYCLTEKDIVSTCPQSTDGHRNLLFEELCSSMTGKVSYLYVYMCCVVIWGL